MSVPLLKAKYVADGNLMSAIPSKYRRSGATFSIRSGFEVGTQAGTTAMIWGREQRSASASTLRRVTVTREQWAEVSRRFHALLDKAEVAALDSAEVDELESLRAQIVAWRRATSAPKVPPIAVLEDLVQELREIKLAIASR